MLFIIARQLFIATLTYVGVCLLLFTSIKNADIQSLNFLFFRHTVVDGDTHALTDFYNYLYNVLIGNWGASVVTQQPIIEQCLSLLPATMELMTISAALAFVLGITLGVSAGIYQGSWFDKTILFASFVGYSTPIFWLGLLSILYISLNLGLTPVSGRIGFLFEIEPVTGFMFIDVFLNDLPNMREPLLSILRHLLLPVFVLAVVPMSVIARMMRNSTIDVHNSDYIQACYAKGLSAKKIIWVHTLRNALIQVMPTIGFQVGALLMGVLVVEAIFSWPGIGKWLIESVNRRDFPAIHGIVILLVGLIVLTNTFIDILNLVLNPKIKRIP